MVEHRVAAVRRDKPQRDADDEAQQQSAPDREERPRKDPQDDRHHCGARRQEGVPQVASHDVADE